jgi:DNA modification methylase
MFRERLAKIKMPRVQNCAFRPRVVQGDARSIDMADGSVDLIVTSPPYIGMIDYAHANRLLYAWMNWTLKDEREREIGARYRRNRKSIASEYRSQMRECWFEMARVMKPGAFCAIVIGESKKFPGSAEEVMHDLGEMIHPVWGPKSRATSRRRVSDRSATSTSESLYVFRKKI